MPESIDFGAVAQGEVASRPSMLANMSEAPIALRAWGVSGGAPFTFSAARCHLTYTSSRGALLMPGRTCTFPVMAQTFSSPTGKRENLRPGKYEDRFYALDSRGGELVDAPLAVRVVR